LIHWKKNNVERQWNQQLNYKIKYRRYLVSTVCAG
jgi:hypothetical protein